MSKLVKFLESLGKSIKKKWSQIWKRLLLKGVKSLSQKSFFFCQILPYYQDFLVLVALSASVKRCFVSHMVDFFYQFNKILHTGDTESTEKKNYWKRFFLKFKHFFGGGPTFLLLGVQIFIYKYFGLAFSHFLEGVQLKYFRRGVKHFIFSY